MNTFGQEKTQTVITGDDSYLIVSGRASTY